MLLIDSSLYLSVITCIQLLRLALFVSNRTNLSLIGLTRGHEGMNLVRTKKWVAMINFFSHTDYKRIAWWSKRH